MRMKSETGEERGGENRQGEIETVEKRMKETEKQRETMKGRGRKNGEGGKEK